MLRFIHILGAIMFLGGITADLAWMKFAERSKRPSDLAFASKTVTLSDFFIALPGAGLLMISGLSMIFMSAGVAQLQFVPALLESLQLSWLITAVMLFNLSGGIWLFLILPRQRRMTAIAERYRSSETLPDEFFNLLSKWYAWGGAATVLPFLALALMVLKPQLW